MNHKASESASFIPKKDSKRRHRLGPRRNIYLFSLFSYVVMFSVLVASLGVFLYGKFLDKKLNEEVVALDTEIKSFNEADLERVVKFDARLKQVAERVNNSFTVSPIFDALEEATLGTVKIADLEFNRKRDDKLLVSLSFEAGNFDAALFQRGVYKRNDLLGAVNIVNVSRELVNTSDEQNDEQINVLFDVVKFKAEIDVGAANLAFPGVSDELYNEINGIEEIEEDESGDDEGGDVFGEGDNAESQSDSITSG